jgi:FAD linked oxidases, C-terminal domain
MHGEALKDSERWSQITPVTVTCPTIVFDGSDPKSVAKARVVFDEMLIDAMALGGTVTGEHGIGNAQATSSRCSAKSRRS